MAKWMEGYEQVPITEGTGPGTYVEGYPWRIVLHTTESPFGSIDMVTQLFQNRAASGFLSAPHVCIDPGTRRKVQYIPLDWSAVSLKAGRNGYETNRGRAIQVEICGYANEAGDWGDDVLDFIAEFCADVVQQGIPINLSHVKMDDYIGTVAIETSRYRFSPPDWKNFDGLCGHIDTPFQDHYDPYHLNKNRIAELAIAKLYDTPQQQTPSEEDELMGAKEDIIAHIDEKFTVEAWQELGKALQFENRTICKLSNSPAEWYWDRGAETGSVVRVHIPSEDMRDALERGQFLNHNNPVVYDLNAKDPREKAQAEWVNTVPMVEMISTGSD